MRKVNKLKLTKRFYDYIKQKGVPARNLSGVLSRYNISDQDAANFQIPEIISETKTHYCVDANDKNIDVLYIEATWLGSCNSGVSHGAKSAYRSIDKIRSLEGAA
jgi:hypothetical protein